MLLVINFMNERYCNCRSFPITYSKIGFISLLVTLFRTKEYSPQNITDVKVCNTKPKQSVCYYEDIRSSVQLFFSAIYDRQRFL